MKVINTKPERTCHCTIIDFEFAQCKHYCGQNTQRQNLTLCFLCLLCQTSWWCQISMTREHPVQGLIFFFDGGTVPSRAFPWLGVGIVEDRDTLEGARNGREVWKGRVREGGEISSSAPRTAQRRSAHRKRPILLLDSWSASASPTPCFCLLQPEA